MKTNFRVGDNALRALIVVLIGIVGVGCSGKRYQELTVEQSGQVIVMPLKMSYPLIYPDFTQEELRQAADDYAVTLRKDVEGVLAKRISVVPLEKTDAYLKAEGLYGTEMDHEDCMNAARKSGGDIVVESYVRLVPVHKEFFGESRRYDVDAEIRLTDVWNTDTLAVFKWQGTRDGFVKEFGRLVRQMKVHPRKKI